MKAQTRRGYTPEGKEIPNHADCSCEMKWLGDVGYLDKCPMHTAAPELLEAAKRIIAKYGYRDDGSFKDWQEWIDLKEAIAKAEGRT